MTLDELFNSLTPFRRNINAKLAATIARLDDLSRQLSEQQKQNTNIMD